MHPYDYFEDTHGVWANSVTTGPEPAKPANAGDEVKLDRVVSGGKVQITIYHKIGGGTTSGSFLAHSAQPNNFIVGERSG